MKQKSVHHIATAIFLSFLSFPSAFAQVDGYTTTVTGSMTGKVCGNTGNTNVTCTGANVPGAGDSTDVTNNKVIVESGATANQPMFSGLYGGYTFGDGNVTGNIAEIKGYTDYAYGGYQDSVTGTGVVSHNEVIVRAGGIVGATASGGIGYAGDVTNNKVTVEAGGTVNGTIMVAFTNTSTSNVIGNIADIRGSVGRYVYGGSIAMGNGDVRDNKVIVSGSVGTYIISGETTTGSGNVVGNMVIIEKSGTVGTDVQVGISHGSGSVIGNIADIKGTVTRDVYGGIAFSNAEVRGNSVSVSGSAGGSVVGGYGSGSGIVSSNVLTIENGGTVNGSSFGGISTGGGKVADSIVTIQKGGSVSGSVIGGQGRGIGEVSGNTVNISGTVGGDIFGGYSTSSGEVTGNTVNISGVVGGSVVAGYGTSTSSGNITNNVVNLYQGAGITGGVFGSIINGTGASFGNTLNINQFRGSAAEINAFQHYNFDLPLGLYAGDTLITITGGTPTDLTGSDVAVSNQFSPGAFKAIGDQITLIDQANGSFTTSFSGTVYGGLSEIYDLSLHNNANALVVEAKNITHNPQSKALSQGIMSEIVTLNRASDLVTESGIQQAKAALKKQSGGPAFFTTVSYADTRTKTGSHIDSDGWAGLMGLALDEGTVDNTGWLAGGFIEGGQGNWNAYSNFTNHSSVYSYGDTDYIGAGVLGHYRFKNRIRLEASARFGHVESDFKARGYAGGLRPEFDLSGMYYSAHAGGGYDLDLSDKLNLDMAANYLWTIRKGENVTTLGERIHFDDINSHRVRAGGRLSYQAATGLQTYAGLYGEYEFDGESNSRNLTSNILHEPTKIRGATGIGEIGIVFTPEAVKNFNVNFSLQGHTGRRDGVVGNVALSWMF